MNGHDKKNENSYSDRTRSRTENSFKLSDTERYVNNNVGNKDTKARFYSEQVRDYTVSSVSSNTGRNTESSSFYIDRSAFVENERNTDKMSSYDESYRQATVSYDADKRHANRTSEIQRDTYADRKLESSQDSLKISDTDRYVNNNVGDRVAQEQLLSNQLQNYANTTENILHNNRDSASSNFQVDKTAFLGNEDRTPIYNESYRQESVSYDISDKKPNKKTSESQIK